MTETKQSPDLSQLFSAALETVSENREQLNALDSNGNHGDNMVENVRVVTNSLRRRRTQTPAEALRGASKALQRKGKGGTSQYYAQGLNQAAQQLEGQTSLDAGNVASLLQSLLGAIPAEGHPQAQQASPSVLEGLAGLMGGGGATAQASESQPAEGLLGQLMGAIAGQSAEPAQPQASEGLLGQLMGAMTGQSAEPAQAAQAQEGGLDAGDVMGMLVPAGLAYLQAKQSGASGASSAAQAALAALMSNQANPLQSGKPRTAAGGLIAQGILKALMGRRR